MNSKEPLVSILLPTYNRALLLEKSILSVLDQSFKNFELLIIDDDSNDGTKSLIDKYINTDHRIKYYKNKSQSGVALSLNNGLFHANGTYIARIDDDDPWIDNEKLSKQVTFLETNSDYALVGTGVIVVNKNGKELFKYLKPETDLAIRSKILFSNPFAHATVLFRKSIIEQVGNYSIDMHHVEDWDLWLRIGLQSKFYNLQNFSVMRFYDTHGVSIKNRRMTASMRLMLINKYKDYYPHFYYAYAFNMLQKIQSYLPYQKKLDSFLFKLKIKTFSRK